jgi:hypothetical protein
MSLWYVMETAQNSYHLQEQLMLAVGGLIDEETAEEHVVSLLARGADVSFIYDRMLPLSCASMNGLARLVQVLIDHDADVSAICCVFSERPFDCSRINQTVSNDSHCTTPRKSRRFA